MDQLDELNTPSRPEGLDVNVVAKQLPVKCGKGTKIFFNYISWILPIPIVTGLIVMVKKAKHKQHFEQIQQKIQHDASQIDNYLEQRVVILKNCAKLLDKALDYEQETLTKIAAYRGGVNPDAQSDAERNEVASTLDGLSRSINIAVERYPDLKAHQEIADAMQQNAYLQKEITAARELYNDSINLWNREIHVWPLKLLVADEEGLKTRIPFIATKEVKEEARGVFF